MRNLTRVRGCDSGNLDSYVSIFGAVWDGPGNVRLRIGMGAIHWGSNRRGRGNLDSKIGSFVSGTVEIDWGTEIAKDGGHFGLPSTRYTDGRICA